jgi:membrane associated rhomboid family serine protease
MIPLRDSTRSDTRPVINTLLVAINIVVFLFELSLGPRTSEFFRQFGVVPVDTLQGLATGRPEVFRPLLTSMFVHGGWLHLIGNMLFLWVFGDNVEDRFGHLRYLLFYLAGGLAANVAHIALNAGSTMPTIGASGAVAAVLGAYTFLFPGARVLTLVPLGFLLTTMELPAKIFLGLWFALQFLSGATALAVASAAKAGGVAWWAHVGGFVFGLAMAFLFYRDRRRRPAVEAW